MDDGSGYVDKLPVPEGDTAFCQVVRRELQRHFVTRQDADAIATEPARQVGQYDAFVFELDAE